MAKACPKCRRPNNDLARKCLYCAQPFTDAPAPQVEASPQAPAPREESPPEAFLVIVAPAQELPRDRALLAGKLLHLDAYSAGIKFRTPAPWTARSFADLEPGQNLIKQLAQAGVDAYLVKQSGIDKLGDRFAARGLRELTDTGIVFLDAQGGELAVDFNDLLLAVRGRIIERKQRDESPDEAEGGVRLGKYGPEDQQVDDDEKNPVRKWIEDRKIKPHPGMLRWVFTGTPIEILDLYRRSSPRAVRLVENEFDYSGLGEIMRPSSLLNFNHLFDHLMGHAPQVQLDTAFRIVGYTTPDTPKEDRVREDLVTKLSAGDLSKRVFDNRAYFDLHSARVYLNLLRERGRKAKAQAAAKT